MKSLLAILLSANFAFADHSIPTESSKWSEAESSKRPTETFVGTRVDSPCTLNWTISSVGPYYAVTSRPGDPLLGIINTPTGHAPFWIEFFMGNGQSPPPPNVLYVTPLGWPGIPPMPLCNWNIRRSNGTTGAAQSPRDICTHLGTALRAANEFIRAGNILGPSGKNVIASNNALIETCNRQAPNCNCGTETTRIDDAPAAPNRPACTYETRNSGIPQNTNNANFGWCQLTCATQTGFPIYNFYSVNRTVTPPYGRGDSIFNRLSGRGFFELYNSRLPEADRRPIPDPSDCRYYVGRRCEGHLANGTPATGTFSLYTGAGARYDRQSPGRYCTQDADQINLGPPASTP